MKLTILIVAVIGFGAVAGAIVVGSMSFDGLVTEDPYETGLVWDETQKNKAESGIKIKLRSNQFKKGVNQIQFQIEKSKPIVIDSVTILRSRPSTDKMDKQVSAVVLSDSSYQAELDFPLVGNWDLIARITTGGKRILFTNRVYVQP